MAVAVELPFSSRPQIIGITLRGVEYKIRLSWNVSARCWVINLSDQFDNPILNGVPLITGADLLRQYGYLGIGGQLFVISDQKPPDIVPGFGDLGITGHTYFVVDDGEA